MVEDKKHGGQIIRDLRIAKGMSIKELADAVNKNYVFLSRMERGMEKPSEELIKSLAVALNYKGKIDVLVASFGRIPAHIQKMMLDDPDSMIELPAFYKKRVKGGSNGRNR
jgi:transcriptional regulator with XRE-family HTH domain